MKSVYEIITEVENAKGSNAKLAIIVENKDNVDLKEFFKLALDPKITFNIKKIPAYSSSYEKILFWSAMQHLTRLSSREITGNAAKIFLTNILEDAGPENAKMIERIIKKDVKCGLSFGSIDKVWPGLILQFPVMKCERHNDKNLENIHYPAFAQKKADGMRTEIFVAKTEPIEHHLIGRIEVGDVLFKTAAGNTFSVCPHLKKQCLNFVEENMVLDGEALIMENGQLLPRKKANGILNKCIQGTATMKDMSKVVLELWDIIEVEDFFKGDSGHTYSERWEYLCDLHRDAISTKHDITKISLIETVIVNSRDEAELFSINQIKNGFEGAVLKNFDTIWENGRSKDQVKFKGAFDADLEIIDFKPHSKKSDLIGSLICKSADGKLVVNVGTGLKKEDIQKPFSFYQGKIAEIQFNEIIEAVGSETKSMFLPVFIRVRTDKIVADTIESINEKILDKIKKIEEKYSK